MKTETPIHSGVYATGSFGVGGRRSGTVRVWFCGRTRSQNGMPTWHPCAHSTRRAAQAHYEADRASEQRADREADQSAEAVERLAALRD